MTKWAVYYIGQQEEAEKYSYQLTFHRRSPYIFSRVVSWKSSCTGAPSDDSHIISNKCLHANIHLLDSYCTGEGDLCFTATILQVPREESIGQVKTVFGFNVKGSGEK